MVAWKPPPKMTKFFIVNKTKKFSEVKTKKERNNRFVDSNK